MANPLFVSLWQLIIILDEPIELAFISLGLMVAALVSSIDVDCVELITLLTFLPFIYIFCWFFDEKSIRATKMKAKFHGLSALPSKLSTFY